jgi:hypothetical protein
MFEGVKTFHALDRAATVIGESIRMEEKDELYIIMLRWFEAEAVEHRQP